MRWHNDRHAHLWTSIRAFYETGDLAHDALHVARVYGWMLRLAADEQQSVDLAGACALVHDQVHIPKDAAERSQASELSARAALGPLRQAGYGDSDIEVISAAVRGSGWSRQQAPANRLGAILQDADRLDALGATGIARTFACAQSMVRGRFDHALYHDGDPFAETDRTLDDRRQAVDHFYVKLLRLADGMHCETARVEAQRRSQFMRDYLAQLKHELDVIR